MSYPEQTTRTARPVNVSYLVMGLVFLGIAGTWALRAGDVVDTSQMQWLVPLVLVAAGAAVFLLAPTTVPAFGWTAYTPLTSGPDFADGVIGLIAFTAKGVVRGRRTRDHVDTEDGPTSFDPYTPQTDTQTDTDTEPTTRIEGDHR